MRLVSPKNSILLSALLLFALGCGDLKTARDILQERSREQINQRLYYYGNSSDPGNYLIIPFNSSDYDSKSRSLKMYTEDRSGVLMLNTAELAQEGALSGDWASQARGAIGELRIFKK